MKKQSRNVVLVHGIFDRSTIFNEMIKVLEKKSFTPLALNLIPNYPVHGIAEMANQLEHYINENCMDASSVSLVGFSLGGIVARYYLQRLGGTERVHKYISISSPHNGTYTGYLFPVKGCLQMTPSSKLLKQLNKSISCLENLDPVSIWTKLDITILPAKSSIMPIGTDYHVPALLHRFMAYDSRVISIVCQELEKSLHK